MKPLSLSFLAIALLASDHVGAAPTSTKHTKVVILGGGVAGIAAAKALVNDGVEDFVILEARSELGGRAQDFKFGHTNQTLEKGCNWIQGLGANPIWQLANKWGLDVSVFCPRGRVPSRGTRPLSSSLTEASSLL
jgi:polyamine oxidase